MWKRIAELPDALKDGRQVLVWGRFEADVATWKTGKNGWNMPESGYFQCDTGAPIVEPTDFAEIMPPA